MRGAGSRASEELVSWASVSDLAFLCGKMRVLPSLSKECQVEALRKLWRSLQWLPAGKVLLERGTANRSLLLIVYGEAEVVLASSRYTPILSDGAYLCEAALLGSGRCVAGVAIPCARGGPAWPLQSLRRLPSHLISSINEFVVTADGSRLPVFEGRARLTRRSLVASLSCQELAAIVRVHDPAGLTMLAKTRAKCNPLQNITSFNAATQTLGAQDVAALRVVCEGPLTLTCQSNVAAAILPPLTMPPTLRSMMCCNGNATTRHELSLSAAELRESSLQQGW
eukprot:NODE_11928_length_1257_cov_5.150442.p1 GENE.NODE_11928_length_1257_cov_5.150442~~NODE_11928_length_1257_cov_5.150442.p1  ORF type:complete len:290 (-),score=48.91 NODE_11928_length_1257_cov_5.150442:388-1233(-)